MNAARHHALRVRNAEIVRLYAANLTLAQVGATVGLNASTVRHVLIKNGVTFRPAGFQRKVDPVAVRAAYMPGVTLKSVGARFGITAAAVHRIVHRGRSARSSGAAA